MSRLWSAGVVAALTLASGASAQPADLAAASKAVVIVVAKGIDNTRGNIEVSTRGTGFFINSDGVLVTANHLRTKLGAGVDEATISYEVYLGTNSLPINAQFVTANGPADLLILYAPVQGAAINVLKPVFKPSPTLVPNSTTLTAIGYPNGFGFIPQPGILTSWGATVSPVQIGWTMSAIFNEGMSGGPVITADGRVAAWVKGVDQGIGIIVPVNYIPSEYWERDKPLGLDVAALPNAGRLIVSRPAPAGTTRKGEQKVVVTQSPCAPADATVVPIVTTAGWSVVPGSVRFSLKSFRGDSLQTDIASTGAGWTLKVSLQAQGTCGPNGTIVGDQAELAGVLTFEEMPTDPAAGEIVVAESASISGTRLPLSSRDKDLTYRLERPDGTSETLKPQKKDFRVLNGVSSLDVAAAAARIDR